MEKERYRMQAMQNIRRIRFWCRTLDLRIILFKKQNLKVFNRVKAFYVIGGNSFALRRAMRFSGFDELLVKYSEEADYLYAGYSAGICVLSKDMSAVSIMDEPENNPYGSGSAPIYEGIDFIKEVIIHTSNQTIKKQNLLQ